MFQINVENREQISPKLPQITPKDVLDKFKFECVCVCFKH